MAKLNFFDFKGVNLKSSPLTQLTHQDGELFKCQNLDFAPIGALTKRSGYVEHLGTVGAQINNLWSWRLQNNTSLFLYNMAADGILRYSAQGTGAWAIPSNGTFSPLSGYAGHAILEDDMVVGDNIGSTRHSTTGTTFTNTTLAPVTNKLAASNANQRIYAAGTSNTKFWSTTGDGSNWALSGTSDSSSVNIPGEGRLTSVNEIAGEIVTTKVGGVIAHWDGFRLFVNPSKEGPSSDRSMADYNGAWFWLNPKSVWGFDGNLPQNIGRPIDDFIRNSSYNAELAPGVAHDEHYMVAVGTITSKILNETVPDAIFRLNVPLNQWSWYRYAHFPTAYLSYLNRSNAQELLFAAGTTGQVYKVTGTATSDAGEPITASMRGFLTMGHPSTDKLLNGLEVFTSPGCGAKFQIAMGDVLDWERLNWLDVGDLHSGFTEYKPPAKTRGKFLFYQLYERSTETPFTFYGFTLDVDLIGK